jgi:hypothetical protein
MKTLLFLVHGGIIFYPLINIITFPENYIYYILIIINLCGGIAMGMDREEYEFSINVLVTYIIIYLSISAIMNIHLPIQIYFPLITYITSLYTAIAYSN